MATVASVNCMSSISSCERQEGRFSDEVAVKSVDECPIGMYNVTETFECKICDIFKITDASGQIACQSCHNYEEISNRDECV